MPKNPMLRVLRRLSLLAAIVTVLVVVTGSRAGDGNNYAQCFDACQTEYQSCYAYTLSPTCGIDVFTFASGLTVNYCGEQGLNECSLGLRICSNECVYGGS